MLFSIAYEKGRKPGKERRGGGRYSECGEPLALPLPGGGTRGGGAKEKGKRETKVGDLIVLPQLCEMMEEGKGEEKKKYKEKERKGESASRAPRIIKLLLGKKEEGKRRGEERKNRSSFPS